MSWFYFKFKNRVIFDIENLDSKTKFVFYNHNFLKVRVWYKSIVFFIYQINYFNFFLLKKKTRLIQIKLF